MTLGEENLEIIPSPRTWCLVPTIVYVCVYGRQVGEINLNSLIVKTWCLIQCSQSLSAYMDGKRQVLKECENKLSHNS